MEENNGKIIHEENFEDKLQLILNDASIEITLRSKNDKIYKFSLSKILYQHIVTNHPYYGKRVLIELDEINSCISMLENTIIEQNDLIKERI